MNYPEPIQYLQKNIIMDVSMFILNILIPTHRANVVSVYMLKIQHVLYKLIQLIRQFHF